MKRSIEILKFLVLAILIVTLFSFTNRRNEKRKLTHIDVEFVDENSPFITFNTVNKLLIQSQEKVTSINKETLVLNEMEQRLLENPMIRDAQVFVTVNGTLRARIEQRTPIGRIVGAQDYYLDEDGKKMPLSTVYSARVPLINGASNIDLKKVADLLLKINEDVFMRESLVGLDVNKDGSIEMQMRKQNFKVLFGKPQAIAKKFQNYKAFYQKTKQDSTLKDYRLVNLQYESQVIATKR
jgi:cell division protein FtsQ